MQRRKKRKIRVVGEKFVRLAIHGGGVIALCVYLLFNLMTAVVYSAQGETDKYQEAKRYFQVGMTAMKNENYKLAEEAFETALENYKASPGTEKYQASCYVNIGVVLELSGRYAEAIENMEQALRLAGTEHDKAGCYLNIGVALKDLKQNTEAIEKIKIALKLFEQLSGTEREQAMCYYNIGLALKNSKRNEEAIEKFKQALSIYKSLPGTEAYQVDCCSSVVEILVHLNRYTEAVEMIEADLKLLEQMPGTKLLRACSYQIAGILMGKSGSYEQSEIKQNQALKLFSQLSGTERDQAICYLEISKSLEGNYRYEEAIENTETALNLFAQLPDTKIDQARCYHNIGAWLLHLNLYEEAMEKEEHALKLFMDLPDSLRDQAGSYTNIGVILSMLGRDELGIDREETALKLYDQLLDTEKEKAVCYRNISIALSRLGRYEESIEKIETALKLYDQLADTERDQALCYHTIAHALGNLGRYGEGIAKERQAQMLLSYGLIRVVKPENKYGVVLIQDPYFGNELEFVQLRGYLGSLYLAAEQLDEALSIFESISGNPWWLASWRAKAYNLRAKFGDIEKAAEQLVKAMDSAEEIRENVFAMENRVGVFEEPSEVFRTAVSLLVDWSGQKVRITEPEITRWMEGIAPEQGLAAAAFHFAEAGKSRALEDALRERAALNLGGQVGDLLTKQRELSLRLSKLCKQQEELPVAETERRKSLTAEIDTLESRMAQMEGEFKRTQLGKYIAPDFRLPAQIALELPERTAVLEYSIGEDGSYLLVLTRKGITAYKLPVAVRALPELHKRQKIELPQLLKAWKKRPQEIGLEGLIYLARARAESRNSNNLVSVALEQAVLERLGSVVLPKEVLKGLRDRDINHLLVVADGVLHMVPFAMLRLKESSGSCYVVERFAVSYVPAMTTLETIRRQKAQRQAKRQGARADLLAFANPATVENEGLSSGTDDSMARMRAMRREYYKSEGLKSGNFPETEEEAMRVAELFAAPEKFTSQTTDAPKGRAVVFSGSGADEAQVKRLLGGKQKDSLPGNWKNILFSTHGRADMRNGMLSCLKLSSTGPDSVEDGYLYAYEVLRLKMDTDVVMLSACETGLGRLDSGEGILGLSMAFFIAGTESVCASFWQVPSEATIQLVTEFFRNLKEGKLDRAEALRQAQLTVMKKGQDASGEKTDYSSPFFWGAFELMGEYAENGVNLNIQQTN